MEMRGWLLHSPDLACQGVPRPSRSPQARTVSQLSTEHGCSPHRLPLHFACPNPPGISRVPGGSRWAAEAATAPEPERCRGAVLRHVPGST